MQDYKATVESAGQLHKPRWPKNNCPRMQVNANGSFGIHALDPVMLYAPILTLYIDYALIFTDYA